MSVCDSGLYWCGDECVDPLIDIDFCGVDETCMGGDVCEDSEACEGGQCLVQCSPPEVRCDNSCIDPMTDPDHCGASGDCSGGNAGEACGSGETCMGGQCRGWSKTSTVVSDTNGINVSPKIAISSTGNAMVVWSERRVAGEFDYDLWGRLYTASTGSWSAPELVASDVSSPQGLFAEGPSSFVAVWNVTEVGVQSKFFDGSSWGNTATLEAIDYPTIAVRDDGGTRGIITWAAFDDVEDEWYVAARIWNPNANTWGSRQILDRSDLTLYDAVGAVASDGSAFAVWNDRDGNDASVYASKFSGSGTWDAPEPVGDTLVAQSGESLEITANGDLLAFWDGRFQGILYDASADTWGSVDTDDAWSNATFCVTAEEVGFLVGRTAGDDGWSRRWNGSSLAGEQQLTPNDPGGAPGLDCAAGSAIAAWGGLSTSAQARRWDEGSSSWAPAETFQVGLVFDVAVSSNGAGAVLLGTNFTGESSGTALDLVVEHFE